MEWFGPQWSGNAQLWWTDAKPGDKLDLGLNVTQPGTYKLSAQLTKANDYAIVQLYLDGIRLGGPIDLYDENVVISDEVAMGEHELDVRVHKLTIEIVGANPIATPAHMVGIDYAKLDPVRDQKTPA